MRWAGYAAALFLLISSFAHAATDTLDPVLCRALVKHVPRADVTYQPGVDVRGKLVAPADLPGQAAIDITQPITIPMTADLLKFLNVNAQTFPFNKISRTDINLGVLTVDGDQVFYNGQKLTGEQQDNLSVLCMKPNMSSKEPEALVR